MNVSEQSLPRNFVHHMANILTCDITSRTPWGLLRTKPPMSSACLLLVEKL